MHRQRILHRSTVAANLTGIDLDLISGKALHYWPDNICSLIVSRTKSWVCKYQELTYNQILILILAMMIAWQICINRNNIRHHINLPICVKPKYLINNHQQQQWTINIYIKIKVKASFSQRKCRLKRTCLISLHKVWIHLWKQQWADNFTNNKTSKITKYHPFNYLQITNLIINDFNIIWWKVL